MLHVGTRCPMDPDAVDAWYPGDLNKMFEKVAYDPALAQFEPVVLSKPPEGPWMIMLEKFHGKLIQDVDVQDRLDLNGSWKLKDLSAKFFNKIDFSNCPNNL